MASLDIEHTKARLPLGGLRVIEFPDGKTDMCGRLLADLGAEVVLVEGPEGSPCRRQGPDISGINLYFATHAANKASVQLNADVEEAAREVRNLLSGADILIAGTVDEAVFGVGESVEAWAERFPGLVILNISDFGTTGPWSERVADNAAHLAWSGVLARSGLAGQRPLLPPGKLAYEAAAVQAAWCALLGYWQRSQTGAGGVLDFSIFEAATQVLDPVLGVTGSAAGGKSASELTSQGRPEPFPLYPTFKCADGYVRVCILNPRQWKAMSQWLGDDHPFTAEKFGNLSNRYKVSGEINALIAALFLPMNKCDVVTEGRNRGIPIATIASPSEVLADSHFNARGAFCGDLGDAGVSQGRMPAGYLEIDGEMVGVRRGAPALGDANVLLGRKSNRSENPQRAGSERRPFQDLRVLDLGVIVAGAELGRLFADQGADVVKIENSQFPDGLRQSLTGEPMTESFAQGQRGKRSLGLNLRSEKGKDLFRQLVSESDIVLSNFKPGTMESLGFGVDVLRKINPGIIMLDSSALGNSGPDSKTMGYGPLVRATAGLTGLWRYPEDEESFSDSTTIFPDHLAARVGAVGVLAALIRREKTGIGAAVSQSQAETILVSISELLLKESLCPGSVVPGSEVSEYAAPYGVFQCAGDDQWCTIGVHTNKQWNAFCAASGISVIQERDDLSTPEGRWENRSALQGIVQEWVLSLSPEAVVDRLQKAGVPSAVMQRVPEVINNPHLKARSFFRRLEQPQMKVPLLTENGPVGRSFLPRPDIRPAPVQFQHTREIARSLLGLETNEIEALIASGDLEVVTEAL